MNRCLRALAVAGLLFCGDTVFLQAQSVLLDDFNRTASNTVATGTNPWVETESAGSNGSKIRTDGTRLVLSGCNSDGTNAVNGAEQAVLDVSGRYATIFSTAPEDLVWQFNMRSSRDLSGFGNNRYGIAFIVGCDNADFTAVTASGYAVAFGANGSSDEIRLVRFAGGILGTLTNIATTGTTPVTDYYSIRVTYNACSSQWTLFMRNDGATTFANPASGTLPNTSSSTNSTHTLLDLRYIGCLWKHFTGCENIVFDNISIPTAAATPATYTWNGASTDFQAATNWTPTRSCLRTNDVLQWNAASPANSTVTNVPIQVIGQLSVADGRQVTLRATTSAKTLSLSGGAGTDLGIAAGSNLIIDGNIDLAISLLAGATADVAGTLTFNNTTPPGSPRGHRLLAADAGAVVFQTGSVFNATKLSGSAFGDAGTANVATFKAGAVYVSRDGGNPFGLAQPAAKVIFEQGSLCRFEQAVGFAAAGRQYANVEISLPSAGTNINFLFGQTGSVCRMDNLLVTQGTLDFEMQSNDEPQNIELTGNLTVMANGTLNFNPEMPSAKSSFTFNGTSAQTVSGSGTITLGPNAEVVFDNAAGVTLGRSLTASGTAQLKSGVVTTGGNELVISSTAANALTSVGNAHVNGTLRRQVAAGQLYMFPVGDGTDLQRADIQFASLDCITSLALRFRTDDPNATAFTPFIEGGVNFGQNLPKGYWQATSNCDPATTSGYELRLYPVAFAEYPTGRVAYAIAKRTGGGNWQQNGTPSNPAGTATFVQADQSVRRTGMAGFSDFAVATDFAPLPLTWLGFQATRVNGQTRLTWLVADEKNNAGFGVQQSGNGRNFKTVSFVKAKPALLSVNTYSFTDTTGGCGYYRLQQRDLDGRTDLSETISVECDEPGPAGFAVYPNPVSGPVTVVFPGGGPATVRLLGLDGTLAAQMSGTPEQVNALLNERLRVLPAGVYVLEMRQGATVGRRKMVKP